MYQYLKLLFYSCSDALQFHLSILHTIRFIILLASITAIAIAIKVSESREVDASVLSRLSRGLQSAKDIERYEREMIVFSIWWILLRHFSSSTLYLIIFQGLYMHMLQSTCTMHHAVRLRNSSNNKSVPTRRSSIAIAAILSTLSKMSQDDLPMEQRTQFIKNVKNVYQCLTTSDTVSDTEQRCGVGFST